MGVVEAKVGVEPGLGLPSVRVSLQVDLFVLHCPPQPLHKDVVSVPPFPVHADSNTIPLDKPGKGLAGELAPLVGVEDLRLSFAQCLLEGLEAEVDIQGVGQAQATSYRLYQATMATRYRRPLATTDLILGAGLSLSYLSSFPGPPQ